MASYRKVKKAAKKAQRQGLLEAGPMFQKWRKASRMSKTGKRRNPLSRKNAKVTMSVKSLRRLVSSAVRGKTARVKARVH